MKLPLHNFLKYGLIMNGVLVICLALMHLTGQYSSFEKGAPLDIIFLLAPFVIWFLGLKAKKKELKNKMTFKEGWVEGIKISLVFGIISPFIFMLYYVGFNPGILTYVRDSYGLEGASKSTVIMVDMFTQLLGSVVMGTVYSVVLALFMKTKPVKT
jgi:hypothetical protein